MIVLVSTIVLGAAAYGLTKARTPTQTARAVLVSPTGAQASLTDNPAASSQLAATYAEILPGDEQLLRAIAKATGDTTPTVRRRLRVTHSADGAIVTLRVGADSSARARKGAQAAVDYLTSASDNGDRIIQPQTVTSTSAPRGMRARGAVSRSRVQLLVSAPSTGNTSDAQAASRLAANYAGLIPEDTAVLRAAAKRAGIDYRTVRDHLRVSNDPNTSLLRLSVTNDDYGTARKAVLGVAAAVTGDDPVSSIILPSSLRVVRRPDATGTAKPGNAGAIVVLAGFLLGLATVIAYGRRHPRLRSAAKTREVLGIPASDIDEWTPFTARSLTRWGEEGAREVVLLPGRPKLDDAAASLAAALNAWREELPDAPHVTARSSAEAWDPRSDSPAVYAVAVSERGELAGGSTTPSSATRPTADGFAGSWSRRRTPRSSGRSPTSAMRGPRTSRRMSPSSAAALGPRDASLRPVAGGSRWVSAAYLAVLAVALLATAVDPLYGVAVALAAVGAAVFAGRPALSAYTMVALVPLISGLGRGVPIPGFRLSELVTVGLGLLVIVTADYRNQRSYTAIDAALALYALATLGLGIAARVRTGDPVSGGDLNVLIGPVQFLIFYRCCLSATQTQRLRALVIVVLSSIVMSLLAILQTLSPAVDTQLRSLTDYNVTDYSGSGIIRASALFPHFQVLSIYLALTILLGVALLVFGSLAGWTRVAVAVAVGLAAVALVETVTLTTIAGTTLGVAALLAMSDRRARYLTVFGVVAVIIGAAFAPTLSKRAHEQSSVVAGTAASDRNPLIPQTVAYRYDVWTKQSIPAMSGTCSSASARRCRPVRCGSRPSPCTSRCSSGAASSCWRSGWR